MNVIIIFALLFTFTLQDKVESNKTTLTSSTTSINTTFTPSTMSINTTFTPSMSFNTTLPPTCGSIFLWNLSNLLIFLLGMIFPTVIFSTVFFFAVICSRCRTTDGNTDKDSIILDAVKSENDQLMMQSDEQDSLLPQGPVEVSTNTSVKCSGTEEEMKILGDEQTEGAGEVNDVNYASINYSLLQKKDGDSKGQKMESDYAEIQLKKPSEEVETLQEGEKQDGVKQHEVKQDGLDQDGVKPDGLDRDLVTQDGLDQSLGELEEVQV